MAHIKESGIISTRVLANKIITFLANNGMTLVTPSGTVTPTTYTATLKSTNTININSTADPASEWYIVIDTTTNVDKLRIMVGTQDQFSANQAVIFGPTGKGIGLLAGYNDPSETNDTTPLVPSVMPNWTIYDFVDRTGYVGAEQSAHPTSYVLNTTPYGISLGIWEDSVDETTYPHMSYMTVQYSVDNKTGVPRVTGKKPLYCLYGINRSDIRAHYRFVVKEIDVSVPSIVVRSDRDTTDGCRNLNSHVQVAILEDYNYAIFYPCNLSTSRFAYPQDDIDLIAYTSADVISTTSNIAFPVYNESMTRSYQAIQSTGLDQTGMRILIYLS